MSAVDGYHSHTSYYEEASAEESDDTKNKKTKGGSSCHQCKSRRNFSALTYCTAYLDKKSKKCRKKFCSHCLKKFYRESVAATASEKQTWVCPSCRRICCCAACRRRKDKDDGPVVIEHPLIGHEHGGGGDGHDGHQHQHQNAQTQLFHHHQYSSSDMGHHPSHDDITHQNKRHRPTPGHDGLYHRNASSTGNSHPHGSEGAHTQHPSANPQSTRSRPSPVLYPFPPGTRPPTVATLNPRFPHPTRTPFFGPSNIPISAQNADPNTSSIMYRDPQGASLSVSDLFQLDPSTVSKFISNRAQLSKGVDADRFSLLYEFARSDAAKQRISAILSRRDLDKQGKVNAVADLLRGQWHSIEHTINLQFEQQLHLRYQQQQQLLFQSSLSPLASGVNPAQTFFQYSPEIPPLSASTAATGAGTSIGGAAGVHSSSSSSSSASSSRSAKVLSESGQHSPTVPPHLFPLTHLPPLPSLPSRGDIPRPDGSIPSILGLPSSSLSASNGNANGDNAHPTTSSIGATPHPPGHLNSINHAILSQNLLSLSSQRKANALGSSFFIGSPLVHQGLTGIDPMPSLPNLLSNDQSNGGPRGSGGGHPGTAAHTHFDHRHAVLAHSPGYTSNATGAHHPPGGATAPGDSKDHGPGGSRQNTPRHGATSMSHPSSTSTALNNLSTLLHSANHSNNLSGNGHLGNTNSNTADGGSRRSSSSSSSSASTSASASHHHNPNLHNLVLSQLSSLVSPSPVNLPIPPGGPPGGRTAPHRSGVGGAPHSSTTTAGSGGNLNIPLSFHLGSPSGAGISRNLLHHNPSTTLHSHMGRPSSVSATSTATTASSLSHPVNDAFRLLTSAPSSPIVASQQHREAFVGSPSTHSAGFPKLPLLNPALINTTTLIPDGTTNGSHGRGASTHPPSGGASGGNGNIPNNTAGDHLITASATTAGAHHTLSIHPPQAPFTSLSSQVQQHLHSMRASGGGGADGNAVGAMHPSLSGQLASKTLQHLVDNATYSPQFALFSPLMSLPPLSSLTAKSLTSSSSSSASLAAAASSAGSSLSKTLSSSAPSSTAQVNGGNDPRTSSSIFPKLPMNAMNPPDNGDNNTNTTTTTTTNTTTTSTVTTSTTTTTTTTNQS